MSRRKRERRRAREAWAGQRQPWQRRFGAFLPAVMMGGFLPGFFISLISGQSRQVLGALLAIGLSLLAAQRIRRAYRRRDLRMAAAMIGVATGLAAHMAGGAPGLIAVILGLMAGFGAHLLYGDLLVEGPVVEEPVRDLQEQAPAPMEEPPFVREARAKLVRAQHTAVTMADPNLSRAVEALSHVLDDLTRTPDHIGEARRFVVVQLDGLTRIAERLDNGATPPATLYGLLDEMAGAANGLRARLRARESEALAIQVKVLQERLRQEGYGPGTGSHTTKE